MTEAITGLAYLTVPPSEPHPDGAVVAKSPQETALGARLGGSRTPLHRLSFAQHPHRESFEVASPLDQAVLGSVDGKARPHRHRGEACGSETAIEAGVCAGPSRDPSTRTSYQFRAQGGPQRETVPRGYVNRTNQHRHPTPRPDHAGEFGKPAVGVDLVQHCARQS